MDYKRNQSNINKEINIKYYNMKHNKLLNNINNQMYI